MISNGNIAVVNFTGPIEETRYMVWNWRPGLTLETDACEDYVEVRRRYPR